MTDAPVEIIETTAKWATDHPQLADPRSAWGRCVLDSDAVADEALEPAGIGTHHIRVTGRTYPGREHWALVLDDLDDPDPIVIDVTMRQFRADSEFPFVGLMSDWLDDMNEAIVDDLQWEIIDRHKPDGEWTIHDAGIQSREDIEPGPNYYPWQERKRENANA